MTSGEIGKGAARIGPSDLAEMPVGAPMRDELLKRWAYVLLEQHGAETAAYIQERRQARALQADPMGVGDWTDVGAIVCELMGLETLPGDGSDMAAVGRSPTADAPLPVIDDDRMPPASREWALWLILFVLAGGILMLLLVVRHI